MHYIAEWNGQRFDYRDSGSGPVILLIHGTQSDYREVYHVEKLITAGYRVIVPSRPGYGRTPLQLADSPETLATFYAGWLASRQIKQYTVYGISAGGPTAIALAGMDPGVHALVLACAMTHRISLPYHRLLIQPVLQRPLQFIQWGLWTYVKDKIRKFPEEAAVRMVEMTSLLPRETIRTHISETDASLLYEVGLQNGPGRGVLFDITQDIERERLEAVTCPVLIVHSKSDRAVPFEHAEHARRSIPHAQFIESKSPGHLIWIGPSARRDERMIERFIAFNQMT
ncbi:alpha/beta hydrolase [Exiguobacterium indicum]|uniref:alpha/beta fold hydrolase n=1 Tax=Exiguobacterium TaxID=33986 RepID=UPI0007378B94|nr:alpha/beta hydrolase [Exiguobacterium indicum]KTR62624.1 alpha/beta hydrolase [Exiguobacterium indicum]